MSGDMEHDTVGSLDDIVQNFDYFENIPLYMSTGKNNNFKVKILC